MSEPSKETLELTYRIRARCRECADGDGIHCINYLDRWCDPTQNIAIALDAFAARAVQAERERCAKLLEMVVDPTDESDLGERAADAYNRGPARRAASERLRDWNTVLAQAIRAGNLT